MCGDLSQCRRGTAVMAAACAVLAIGSCLRGVIAAPLPADNRIEVQLVGALVAPSPVPLRMPTDVAVDGKGRVFVADGVNDRIVRFSPGGSVDGTLERFGDDRLNRPIGVSVDASDRLWIADSGNHRVIIAGPDGTRVETIVVSPPDGGRLPGITDAIVTSDGRRVYIVDNHNHRLLVREGGSETLEPIGRFGRAIGQFEWPFLICTGPGGDVYVSESIGARVQRIGATGRWAGQVPGGAAWGVELGQLYRPKGVAVDAGGRLYVSDSTLGVVQVFGPRGDLVGVLTDGQGEPMRFRHPMGMCFDAKGRLYVVELKADRVVIISSARWAAGPETRPAVDSKGGGP